MTQHLTYNNKALFYCENIFTLCNIYIPESVKLYKFYYNLVDICQECYNIYLLASLNAKKPAEKYLASSYYRIAFRRPSSLFPRDK